MSPADLTTPGDGRLPPTRPRANWLFLTAAVCMTLLHLACMRPEGSWQGDDYTAYVRNGSSLLHGQVYRMQGYTENPNMDAGLGAYPPMYPALLALPIAIAGEDLGVLTGATIVLFGAFLLLFMLYAHPLTGTLGALLSGVVVGLGPFAFYWKDTINSEFALLPWLALAFLAERWRAHNGGIGAAAATAASSAAAVLTRLVGAALWPALLAADVLRTRRISLSSLVIAGASITLTVGSLAAVQSDAIAKYMHVAGVLADPPAGGMGIGERIGIVADNLREAPGKLSMVWSFGGQLNGRRAAWYGAFETLANAALLALGLAGVVLCAWRGATVAELFFVFELAGLMLFPRALISTRVFLPLSAFLVMYAFVTMQTVADRLNRLRVALPVLCFLGFGAVAAFAYQGLLTASPTAAMATSPPVAALLAWIRENTDANAMILTRSPRAVVYYTGRPASDFHLAPADAGFAAWAASLRANYIIINVEMAEVLALGGGPPGMDRYAARFLGGSDADFPMVFTNHFARVFRIERLR